MQWISKQGQVGNPNTRQHAFFSAAEPAKEASSMSTKREDRGPVLFKRPSSPPRRPRCNIPIHPTRQPRAGPVQCFGETGVKTTGHRSSSICSPQPAHPHHKPPSTPQPSQDSSLPPSPSTPLPTSRCSSSVRPPRLDVLASTIPIRPNPLTPITSLPQQVLKLAKKRTGDRFFNRPPSPSSLPPAHPPCRPQTVRRPQLSTHPSTYRPHSSLPSTPSNSSPGHHNAHPPWRPHRPRSRSSPTSPMLSADSHSHAVLRNPRSRTSLVHPAVTHLTHPASTHRPRSPMSPTQPSTDLTHPAAADPQLASTDRPRPTYPAAYTVRRYSPNPVARMRSSSQRGGARPRGNPRSPPPL